MEPDACTHDEDVSEEDKLAVEAMPEDYGKDELDAELADLQTEDDS